MEVKVYDRPNIMVETVELVSSWFNQVNPKNMTASGSYCIPATEIKRMMNEVCCDLDPEDAQLRFYFQGLPGDDPSAEKRPIACVAGLVIRSELHGMVCALEEYRQHLHNGIMGGTYPRIITFTGSGVGISCRDNYSSIADGLIDLNMSDLLKLRLVETMANYHHHVDVLCNLLEPLARRLESLLEPWIEKMQPKVQQWREELSTQEGVDTFCARLNTNLDGLECIYMTMCMLYPHIGGGSFSHEEKNLRCAVGLTMPAGIEKRQEILDLDMAGLRLLSGKDRVEMLRAMSGRSMSQKEVTKELGINSGTVFRDLSSLTAAHLLSLTVKGDNRTYTTNMEYLEKLTERLLEYIRQGR